MTLKERIKYWVDGNPATAAGGAAGFAAAVFILIFGPMGTLLIFLFVIAGLAIGRFRDEKYILPEKIKRLFKK